MSDSPPTRRRRGGRPALDTQDHQPSVKLDIRVTAKMYDAAYAQSRAERVPFADWVRQRLKVEPPRDR
jgi:hypothetical protein